MSRAKKGQGSGSRGLILDLCGTLYVSESLSSLYKQKLVEAVASKEGLSASQATAVIDREKIRCLHRLGYTPSTLYLAIRFGVKVEYMAGTNLVNPRLFIDYSKGVEDTVSRLAEKFHLAILTHSTGYNTKRILGIMRIKPYFDVVFGAEDITHPKPNPESFVRVAQQLGIPSESIIMVGDRPEIDLEPAKNLGMRTVLIGTALPNTSVDVAVPTLSCLLGGLRRLNSRDHLL